MKKTALLFIGILVFSCGKKAVRSVQLYSLAGKLMQTETPPNNNTRTLTFLPVVSKGTYLVVVQTDGGIFRTKFVKR